MCLIIVAWQAHPRWPLVVVANRDEFHARPTVPLAPWPDVPGVIAGRDLAAGGTWLGVAQGEAGTFRFAAVTNVREPGAPPGSRSRGALTRDYLAAGGAAAGHAAGLAASGSLTDYAGFNLLLADDAELWYLSNRAGHGPRPLGPGIHGLSNHLLDTPWPKLTSARHALSAALPALPDTEACFTLLADDGIVPDPLLPATGVSLEWERRLSAIFVRSPAYGTRAATVLLRDAAGHTTIEERSFAADGTESGRRRIEFAPGQACAAGAGAGAKRRTM